MTDFIKYKFPLPFVIFHLDSDRMDLCQSLTLSIRIWQSLWAVNLQKRHTKRYLLPRQLKSKAHALRGIVLSNLHSYGRSQFSAPTYVVVPPCFAKCYAVLRQRSRLAQAATNPAVPLPARPHRSLQQAVSRAAVFGSHPDSWTPSVGHQLPGAPHPVEALCWVAVLTGASRAHGGVVSSSRGATWGALRPSQVHWVAVLLGAPRAWSQLSTVLEVGILGGLGATLGSHRERRLGHARWKWGRSTFTIRKDWSIRTGERKTEEKWAVIIWRGRSVDTYKRDKLGGAKKRDIRQVRTREDDKIIMSNFIISFINASTS